MAVLALGCTKLSVLLLYKRIFCGEILSISLWVMLALTFLWTVGFFLFFSSRMHSSIYQLEQICKSSGPMYRCQPHDHGPGVVRHLHQPCHNFSPHPKCKSYRIAGILCVDLTMVPDYGVAPANTSQAGCLLRLSPRAVDCRCRHRQASHLLQEFC